MHGWKVTPGRRQSVSVTRWLLSASIFVEWNKPNFRRLAFSQRKDKATRVAGEKKSYKHKLTTAHRQTDEIELKRTCTRAGKQVSHLSGDHRGRRACWKKRLKELNPPEFMSRRSRPAKKKEATANFLYISVRERI